MIRTYKNDGYGSQRYVSIVNLERMGAEAVATGCFLASASNLRAIPPTTSAHVHLQQKKVPDSTKALEGCMRILQG